MNAGDRVNDVAGRQPAPMKKRGRLKVLLGAAPGVGKTYEMLLDGRKLDVENYGIDPVRLMGVRKL